MRFKSRLSERISRWFGAPAWRRELSHEARRRGPLTHIVILDGTMSTLEPGEETNAGLTFKLLQELGPHISLYYEAGVQWRRMPDMIDVMMGRGINRQIRRAYGYLASRYRPGDRIILMGYSRGAYAVRSLAGVIDAIGLLKPDEANVRNIRTAYRHYQSNPHGPYALQFRRRFCHDQVDIDMVGVWDTVKALGLRLPLLWRLAEIQHGFHSHHLGLSVKAGFHALALDETRIVYEPILWDCPPNWPAEIEQVWFRGSHGDIGGQLAGVAAARPLANIPLVWMLEKLESRDVPLPPEWRRRFPQDVTAPSSGSWKGWARIFLLRRKRSVGHDRTERLHESVARHHVPPHADDSGPPQNAVWSIRRPFADRSAG